MAERHRQVIARARAEQTLAQSRFYTADSKARGVEDWQLAWPSRARPLLRALTRGFRELEAGSQSREHEAAALEFANAIRNYESLVTVDGLNLDTFRGVNNSHLEHIRGFLGDPANKVSVAHLVLYGSQLRGSGQMPDPPLRERFGGVWAGKGMSPEGAKAFFEQFYPVLAKRNEWEGVRGRGHVDNVAASFQELITP